MFGRKRKPSPEFPHPEFKDGDTFTISYTRGQGGWRCNNQLNTLTDQDVDRLFRNFNVHPNDRPTYGGWYDDWKLTKIRELQFRAAVLEATGKYPDLWQQL